MTQTIRPNTIIEGTRGNNGNSNFVTISDPIDS